MPTSTFTPTPTSTHMHTLTLTPKTKPFDGTAQHNFAHNFKHVPSEPGTHRTCCTEGEVDQQPQKTARGDVAFTAQRLGQTRSRRVWEEGRGVRSTRTSNGVATGSASDFARFVGGTSDAVGAELASATSAAPARRFRLFSFFFTYASSCDQGPKTWVHFFLHVRWCTCWPVTRWSEWQADAYPSRASHVHARSEMACKRADTIATHLFSYRFPTRCTYASNAAAAHPPRTSPSTLPSTRCPIYDPNPNLSSGGQCDEM
jgi:hypothetical protein